MLLPAIVTPILTGLIIAVTGGNLLLLILMPFIGLTVAGAQYWNYRNNLRKHEAEEAERREKYRAYLKEKEDEIISRIELQQKILWREYPSVSNLMKWVEGRSGRIWQRQPDEDDFLEVRIGSGKLPASITIKTPGRDLDGDELLGEAEKLRQKYSAVPGLPLTTNLNKLGTIGIRGRGRDASLEMAYTMLANLVAHHSPDVLQLFVFSHRPNASEEWKWVRWLPSTGLLHQNGSAAPRISFNSETDDELLSSLFDLLNKRLERSYDTLRFTQDPHYVIIFDQCPHLLRHKVTNLLLGHKPGNRDGNLLRASALFIDERPPNVNALIDVEGEMLEYWETWAANATENQIKGNAELTSRNRIEHLARSLAPLRTEAGNKAQGGDFPSNVRLVELLGATQPPEIELSKTYRDRYDPLQVMEFPIGINSEGKPQKIILRDDARKGYGPHAMLAGATGKGKSITLQSIVLSLAVNNSPAHLNFVLADFKGGASELARLRDLPHVVGFVTDLDEPNVERFRLALEGEVRRRKRILAETPQTLGRQIPDMYEYNREMAQHPVPHLVVVIDEFAKALQINPAFKVTLDKDIAAQGRALGIHLILSTQKADDFAGIRPNIEVRMSMQVQSAEDSRAIFNRDDAARKLTRAGQAFIQVGDNRIFEMVQVARTDIPYAPDGADSLELVNDFTIRQILPNGRYKLLYQKKTKGEIGSQEVKIVRSEAEVLVAHIKQYCEQHFEQPRMICLPPLPDATGLPLFSLLKKHPAYSRWQNETGWDQSQMLPAHRLSIPLGMIDNPSEQEQRPFFLDLTVGDGNFVVVGPAGSGKALFLRSLVLGLAVTHPPSELIFYFLSQGPTLSIFEDLPHCQAFIQPAETERIMRFFSLLEYEIERRTELMRASRVDSLTSIRFSHPGELMPAIVIVFDDFGRFSSTHYNRLKDIEDLAAVARQVDIHLVLSVGALNSIHWKIQQNISGRLGLGKVNTLEIFRKQAKVLPAKPGRGYIIEDNSILECQIASPTPLPSLDADGATSITEMSDIIAAVNATWEWPNDQRPLPPILELPHYIELSSLWEQDQATSDWYDKPTAPIGMDYNLEKIWVEFNVLEPFNLVVGPPQSGKTEFLLTLALASAKNLPPSQLDIYIVVPKQHSNLRLLRNLPNVQFVGNVRSAKKRLGELEQELKERALEQKETIEPTSSGTIKLSAYSPKRTLILIDDVQRFSRDKEAGQILDNCMEYGNSMSTIYLFVADTGNNINQAKQDFNIKYIQAVCRYGSGVAFSTEGADFTLLNLGLKVPTSVVKQHAPDIGRGRGFWVHNSEPKIVQFALVAEETANKADYESAVKQLIDDIIEQHHSEGQHSQD